MESTGSSQIEDGGVADFANRWGHNFWRLVYRMAYRLIVMKYWVLGVLVFGIAMFVDAAEGDGRSSRLRQPFVVPVGRPRNLAGVRHDVHVFDRPCF